MDSPTQFAQYLKNLRKMRETQKTKRKSAGNKRKALTQKQRQQVLEKTDRRCHICGGDILGTWHADHVRSHSSGGEHVVDNYLPAHPSCNNYRWDYLPEEFELILKLGVMARTEIEKQSEIGNHMAAVYLKQDRNRRLRRKG